MEHFVDEKDLLHKLLEAQITGEQDDRIESARRAFCYERVSKPAIFISTSSSGRVAGAGATEQRVVGYLNEKGIDADVIRVGSIGITAIEPVLDVQLPGKTRVAFRNVNATMVETILDAMLNNSLPEEYALGQYANAAHENWRGIPFMHEIPFLRLQKRLILENCGIINPNSIADYIARGGYTSWYKAVRQNTGFELVELITQSGLRGRGGGGYNAGQKWAACLQNKAQRRYLVCNADESDPGAFMDRAIIEGNPHLLVEGIAIAAYAIGADMALIYIRSEYRLAVKRLQQAIEQAMQINLLGDNIFGGGISLRMEIREGAGAFICGEETALLNSLEGKRGMPYQKPPYPSVSGFYGYPTVVNNVETLANVPLIVAYGSQWFRSIGTPESPGTKVFSVSGQVQQGGLIEIPMGTSMRHLIFEICKGMPNGKNLKAVQLGGPTGSCIAMKDIDLQVDFENIHKLGATMGSGGMVVIDDATCMVELSVYFMNFLSNESCGKCIPCREGTRKMHDILVEITHRPHAEKSVEALERFRGVAQLDKIARVVQQTSMCGFGKTAANPVLSLLKSFRKELEQHVFERYCQCGVCVDLRTCIINVDTCTGCHLCIKKCPENAIIGSPKMPHFIVSEKCTGCGKCIEVCKFNAISFE